MKTIKRLKYVFGILLIISVAVISHNAFKWKLINKVDVNPGSGQQSIVVRDGFAYYISDRTMRVFDVSEPIRVHEVGKYSGDVGLDDIALYEDFAVLSSLDKGLLVIDIHNPETPSLVGLYPKTGSARFGEIVIKDNYALVADHTAKSIDNPIIILDLIDPMEIREVSRVANSGEPLAVRDNYLYAKGHQVGDMSSVKWLNIIDISDLREPKLVLHSSAFGAVLDAKIQDHYLYIGTADDLVIADISNPVGPIEVGRVRVLARKLVIQDEFIYYMGFEKVGMLKITSAESAEQIAITREVRYATDIAYSMNHVYFVGGSSTLLYIFEGGEK